MKAAMLLTLGKMSKLFCPRLIATLQRENYKENDYEDQKRTVSDQRHVLHDD